MSTDTLHRSQTDQRAAAAATIRPFATAFRLSIALAIVAAVASALTAFLPEVLRGPAVMNGSARGTGLIILFVTVPVLAIAIRATAHGSTVGLLVWIGAAAHVLYQSVLFLFATPFNDLFLLYVAMSSLALWSLAALLVRFDTSALRARITPGLPTRPIAIYVWVVVALNTVAWLGPVVRSLGADGEPAFLVGTGMITNPVYVQDLVFWLPLMALGAWGLWRDRDWGYPMVGSMLTMWLIEGITVATDQWMGHEADPASSVAALAGVWIFGALALIGVVPLAAFYRHVENLHDDEPGPTPSYRSA
jgi:hypothetical protein